MFSFIPDFVSSTFRSIYDMARQPYNEGLESLIQSRTLFPSAADIGGTGELHPIIFKIGVIKTNGISWFKN